MTSQSCRRVPGEVHGQFIQQLRVFLRLLHQGNLGLGLRKLLHFFCEWCPGAVQLGR